VRSPQDAGRVAADCDVLKDGGERVGLLSLLGGAAGVPLVLLTGWAVGRRSALPPCRAAGWCPEATAATREMQVSSLEVAVGLVPLITTP
jgi:hypothetical protein